MDVLKHANDNARTFLLYRVFFRARYYYPIFTLLFLDFGLTLSQFAILNSIWALTIVLFEIPLGALSDVIGRKKIVIFSAILLNLELLIWLFAPIDGGNKLFYFFLANRIISGICEAASSGADEALAYDSLKKAKLEKKWPSILEKTQRYTSLYFIFVLLVGAMVYDPNIINTIISLFGSITIVDQKDCIKIPIFINLMAALMVLFQAFQFHEVTQTRLPLNKAAKETIKNIFKTIIWIKKSATIVILLIIIMLSESIILQFLTLMQKYWKVIEIPIFYYGIIGSVLALCASSIPALGKYCYNKLGFKANFSICYINLLLAFILISLSINLYGVLPVILLYCTYQLIIFLNGCYIHDSCNESNRATVLSFQSMLSFSKYGILSITYSYLVTMLSNSNVERNPDIVFEISLFSFPTYFLISTILIYLIAKKYINK